MYGDCPFNSRDATGKQLGRATEKLQGSYRQAVGKIQYATEQDSSKITANSNVTARSM